MKKNIIVFIGILIFSGVFSCCMGFDRSFDLYSYHYYNAFAVLNNRIGFDIMPSGIQSYLNPVLDIIDYLIINIFHNNKYIVLFLFGIPYGFYIFVLYLINKNLFKYLTRDKITNIAFIIFATLIGATECFIVSEIGTVYHDINVGVFTLLSVLFSLYYFETKKVSNICFAGFFAGISCGLKLVTAPYVLALFLTSLIFCKNDDYKYLLYKMFLLVFFSFLGFLTVDGYWMYILWEKFHNPIFPMYNKIFQSEWFEFINYHDTKFMEIDINSYLFYPLVWTNVPPKKVGELEFFDFRHSFAYFCMLYSLLWLCIKTISKKFNSYFNKKYLFIIVFVLISYLMWIKYFSILRYFIPVLGLCGTIITICISQIKYITVKRKRIISFLVILFLGSFIHYKFPAWGREDTLIYIPKLNLEENSVVLLYGKPVSYYAAQKTKNTRFIYLYDETDGQDIGVRPSKKYYDYIDTLIKDKKKYIIMCLDEEEIGLDKNRHKYLKKKYLNSKLKCTEPQKLFFYGSIVFCEYPD